MRTMATKVILLELAAAATAQTTTVQMLFR